MNTAGETSLVWSLMDVAKPIMRPATRTWLCTKIGAGDRDAAIRELLACVAHARAEISTDLAMLARQWLSGYVGSDVEAETRELVDAVAIASVAPATVADVMTRADRSNAVSAARRPAYRPERPVRC